jgi:hypothetical protein
MKSKVSGPFPIPGNDGETAVGDLRTPAERRYRPTKEGTRSSQDVVTKQMDRALRHAQTKPDEFLRAAALATLRRTTW